MAKKDLPAKPAKKEVKCDMKTTGKKTFKTGKVLCKRGQFEVITEETSIEEEATHASTG